jgi:hypothetical protein
VISTVMLASGPILATVYLDDSEEYVLHITADIMFALSIVTLGLNGDLEGILVVCVDDPDSGSPEKSFRRLGVLSGQAMVRLANKDMKDSYQAYKSRRDEVVEEFLGLDQPTIRLW